MSIADTQAGTAPLPQDTLHFGFLDPGCGKGSSLLQVIVGRLIPEKLGSAERL
jgi:hypothetical protein